MTEPDRTADGHHIVVDGRRWRASDPTIPDAVRSELVTELMSARRAVKAGEADARERVQDAKVALGERGEAWWDEPTDDGRRQRVAAAMHTLARRRAPEGTTCPSDVARAVGGEGWRGFMELTREVARDLAREGQVEVTQGGEAVDPDARWRGPVRIRAVTPDR